MEIRIEDIGAPPVPCDADDGQLSEASALGPVDWNSFASAMSNHINWSNWRFPRSRYFGIHETIAQSARRALRTTVHGSVQGIGGSRTKRIVTAGPNAYGVSLKW